MSDLSVRSLLNVAARQLTAVGNATPLLDASLLLAHVLGEERSMLLFAPERQVSIANNNIFQQLIERRRQHEPIAYLLGKKEFWSLDFLVTPATLIPRPDSETLIEAAIEIVQKRSQQDGSTPRSLLDIGTGSGCLLLSLLKEVTTAWGLGIDISEAALQVAVTNADAHSVGKRAVFMCNSWCDAIYGEFDIIISNPPYIPEGDKMTLARDVTGFEPHQALFAGLDGLAAYRVLAPEVKRLLAPGGAVLMEVGIDQAAHVAALLSDAGLHIDAVKKDLSGIERCVVAINH